MTLGPCKIGSGEETSKREDLDEVVVLWREGCLERKMVGESGRSASGAGREDEVGKGRADIREAGKAVHG